VLLKTMEFLAMGGSGFQTPSSTSRPPTKAYDKTSHVLIFEESELNLKFLKMHLNKFFSHVTVARSSADAVVVLKSKDIDVVICDAEPSKKSNTDFFKKLGLHWNHIPVIALDTLKKGLLPDLYARSLVVAVVDDPLNLDPFHIAIRRSLNIRDSLRCLAAALGPKAEMGDIVRKLNTADLNGQQSAWLREIRFKLIEEIVD
jgi:DNA-binding NtrC family response regulator